jgi:hypothetical protein
MTSPAASSPVSQPLALNSNADSAEKQARLLHCHAFPDCRAKTLEELLNTPTCWGASEQVNALVLDTALLQALVKIV